MKKLFFTTIAVVAFSGVSLAEVKTQNLSNEFIKINCYNVYVDTFGAALAAGATQSQAGAIAIAAYERCLSINQ